MHQPAARHTRLARLRPGMGRATMQFSFIQNAWREQNWRGAGGGACLRELRCRGELQCAVRGGCEVVPLLRHLLHAVADQQPRPPQPSQILVLLRSHPRLLNELVACRQNASPCCFLVRLLLCADSVWSHEMLEVRVALFLLLVKRHASSSRAGLQHLRLYVSADEVKCSEIFQNRVQ